MLILTPSTNHGTGYIDALYFFCYSSSMSDQPLKTLEIVKEIHANLEAFMSTMNDFASQVERRFEAIDRRFEAIDRRFELIDKRFEQIDKRFDRIESTMVTKDYLDEELASLRGDLVVVMRKEDRKLEATMEARFQKLHAASN